MIIANQKSVRRSERKLANKIMINGKSFFQTSLLLKRMLERWKSLK